MTRLHSFGGHSMDRYLFDFDTDDGSAAGAPDAGGGAAPSPATAAADPAAPAGEGNPPDPATADGTPPAAAAPTLDPVEVQAELDYLRNQNEQLAQFLQQGLQTPGGAQQQTPGLPDFDPLDPDSVRAYNEARDAQILARMEQLISGVAQPLAEQQHAQHVQQLTETVNDLMEDNIARHGDFVTGTGQEAEQANGLARNLVDTLAANLYPTVTARYGQGPRAMEIALTQAADQVRTLLKAAGVGAQTQQANQLATLAGARGEPGVGAGTGLQTTPAATTTRESLAQKYADRSRAARTAA